MNKWHDNSSVGGVHPSKLRDTHHPGEPHRFRPHPKAHGTAVQCDRCGLCVATEALQEFPQPWFMADEPKEPPDHCNVTFGLKACVRPSGHIGPHVSRSLTQTGMGEAPPPGACDTCGGSGIGLTAKGAPVSPYVPCAACKGMGRAGSGRAISVAKRFVGTEARVTIGTGGAELRVERFVLEPTRPSYEALIDDALKACEASAMAAEKVAALGPCEPAFDLALACESTHPNGTDPHYVMRQIGETDDDLLRRAHAADVVRRFPAPPLPGGLRYPPVGSKATMRSAWNVFREWEAEMRPADPNEAWAVLRLCAASNCLPSSTLAATARNAANLRDALGEMLTKNTREGEALIAQMNAIDEALDEVAKAKGGAA